MYTWIFIDITWNVTFTTQNDSVNDLLRSKHQQINLLISLIYGNISINKKFQFDCFRFPLRKWLLDLINRCLCLYLSFVRAYFHKWILVSICNNRLKILDIFWYISWYGSFLYFKLANGSLASHCDSVYRMRENCTVTKHCIIFWRLIKPKKIMKRMKIDICFWWIYTFSFLLRKFKEWCLYNLW